MNDQQNRAGALALSALHEAEKRYREKKRKPKKPAVPKSVIARCVYCGQRCRSRKSPATCRIHMDLPALDPHYQA